MSRFIIFGFGILSRKILLFAVPSTQLRTQFLCRFGQVSRDNIVSASARWLVGDISQNFAASTQRFLFQGLGTTPQKRSSNPPYSAQNVAKSMASLHKCGTE
jgi:hypothetical protein